MTWTGSLGKAIDLGNLLAFPDFIHFQEVRVQMKPRLCFPISRLRGSAPVPSLSISIPVHRCSL